MEGAHGELCTRFADSLCSDRTNCFADIYHILGREVHTVANLAHSVASLAGHRRARHDRRNSRSIECFSICCRKIVTFLEQYRTVLILCVFGEHASAECFSVIRLDAGSAHAIDFYATAGATIFLGHDRILCDVEEAAGEITGFCGTERRVSETLAGAVRRHEVLNRVQSLDHRGDDRHFDRHAGRVLNKTLHTCHLSQVAERSASA